MESDSSDSDYEYEICTLRSNSCALPFDPASIENIILAISDHFDFRVIINDKRARGAFIITAGLAIAGGLVGKHYGGKTGAIIGSAIGGACGVGIIVVSMRDIWDDIKENLSELMEIVYDYLAGLGLEDYKTAAYFLANQSGYHNQLALLILKTASSVLGKKILSSLTAA